VTASSENSPPIPREPIGLTFVLAMSLIGLLALVQVIAVLIHYGPQLREQAAQTSAANRELAEAPEATPVPVATPPPAAVAPAQPAQTVSVNDQNLMALLGQSDQAFRIGDYDQVLKILEAADAIAPGDARIIFRRALAQEGLGHTDEAVANYQKAATMPGLPEELRKEALRKVQILGGSDDNSARQDSATSPTMALESPNGQDVRDDVGLQPGSTLGLIDAQLKDGDTPATKVLHIATKARPGVKVDSRLAQVRVYFYEKDEAGNIVLTSSHLTSQWTSAPIDWANGDPELLEVHYSVPTGKPDSTGASRQYYGYVIGLYYNNELQDTRADPGDLARQFPLPLYLTQQPQDQTQDQQQQQQPQ
jgi:tetratricopeptide (TPR) repeat protein